MFEREFHIAGLIKKQLDDVLDEASYQELQDWLSENPSNSEFHTALTDSESFQQKLSAFESAKSEALWTLTKAKVADAAQSSNSLKSIVVKFKRFRAIAAAAAIAAIVAGVYFFSHQAGPEIQSTKVQYAQEIAPGRQGATLTLANGKKIRLYDVVNGKLAVEDDVVITKSSTGQLVYEVKGPDSGTNKTNTLSTAKGENYSVRLPDGSLVYLNAASSLTYPTSFAKHNERRVVLSGEGYFEISKDKTHPFIVESDHQQVEVLGTHFNINAYSDEESVKTTLLEGRVRVTSSAGLSHTIKPGEQVQLQEGKMNVRMVDPDEAIAWKNGMFDFNDADLKAVMRQLSRWYDVTIKYEGKIPPRKFSGQISKNIDAAQLLEILSFKKIHYTISNNTIRCYTCFFICRLHNSGAGDYAGNSNDRSAANRSV